MADQRALYESLSRRGVAGSREGAARRQRTVIFALIGILMAVAVATQFMTSGKGQHPVTSTTAQAIAH